jgi:sporulation protein YlmC with PRC-barrel domain
MRLSDESLRGRTIITVDGQVIGQIAGFLLDSDDWSVESLQITLRKDVADAIGAHRSVFQAGKLEIPVRLVHSVGDTVVLTVATDELRKVLPSETTENAPAH